VFVFFMLTMLFLMIKSRFIPVGIDNSYQFAKEFASLMAEKITYEINVDKTEKEEARAFYIDKERMIEVEGIKLKICLPK
jgi:hypothetical protein